MTDQTMLMCVMLKGDEQYIVSYTPDQACAVKRILGKWAMDEQLSFNWYDAAALSARMRVMERGVR